MSLTAGNMKTLKRAEIPQVIFAACFPQRQQKIPFSSGKFNLR